MTLEEQVRAVTQRFGQKGVRVDSDWLNGCVEFFISEEPSISPNQLYQQAEEQWELSDLSDSGVKCLPDTIFNKKEIQTINGTFTLQIQHLLDISESPYDQLQKLQDKEVEMGKEQPEFKQTYQKTKKKRMLKLELTDGYKTVSALEYSPIPCLSTQLAPGLKIIVCGPLRCVNHILFLDAKNVRILGGEITSMVIENAYENMLRKKLNQPINPNPKTDYQEATVAADTTAVKRAENIPAIPMSANKVIQSNVISSASNFDVLDEFPDDDFLTDIDIDQIASKASSTQVASNASTSRQEIPPNGRSTLLFDDMDDNDFLNIESVIEQQINAVPQNVQNQASEVATRNEASNNIVLNTTVDAPIFDEKYRFKIRGINLVTIKQLKESARHDLERRKHFLVKAEIDEIIQKARVSSVSGKWMMKAALTDQMSENVLLEATFHASVIDKLAGKSGREISHLMAQRSERPQNVEDVQNTLKKLTDCLEKLNMFIKLEFNSNAELPIVVELIDVAPVLIRKLQEKIEHEKLM